MRTVTIAAAAALHLAGCASQEPAAEAPAQQDASPASPAATASTMAEPAAEAENFLVKKEDGDASLTYEYRWPAAADAIPMLAARLGKERDQFLADWQQEWQQALDESPADCVPCRNRFYRKQWQVVTRIPRFLSLSADIAFYTGGAHGMQTFDALIWDIEETVAIEPVEMFASAAAIDKAAQPRFCDRLDQARAKKRGGPVKRTGEWSTDCIAPSDNATIILGSRDGEAFDKVGFLIPPYNAGAYAEGSYEVTLPVDDALLAAVKPEYRAFFAKGQ